MQSQSKTKADSKLSNKYIYSFSPDITRHTGSAGVYNMNKRLYLLHRA